jgi:hypothetical protein
MSCYSFVGFARWKGASIALPPYFFDSLESQAEREDFTVLLACKGQ